MVGTASLGLGCAAATDKPAHVTAVSAGDALACALLSNHRVECWGANVRSELGNGQEFVRSLTPVSVSGITNATAVSAGSNHACALLSTHRIQCWGANDDGQLGNGEKTYTDSATPVAVGGITRAIDVSVGVFFTCALLSDHTIDCWGANYSGQLGDGGEKDRSIPTPVVGIRSAIQVRAGFDHACALLSGGAVKCWGTGGELGDGTMLGSSTPVPVIGVTNAVAISAGDATCALLADGRVKCWGANDFGQLGNGKTANVLVSGLVPAPVSTRGITMATAVSAGNNHSCALLSDRNVECWGRNDVGQLGSGTTASSSIPVHVKALVSATQVSAGRGLTCALLSSGQVVCWGANDYGQLGDGKRKDSSIPTRVAGLGSA